LPPLNLYARVRFFAILHARPPVQRAPGIPCALYSQSGETFLAKLGQIPPRDREVVSEIVLAV
jgi:hypothetical protein